MAQATQNWLGVSINFDNVDDRSSESNFELLPEGFYKAQIKTVNKGVVGKNNKPALIVALELEEGKKEFTHSLFLPENGDEQTAIDFKNQNLRNFFTRCHYSNLTKDEYNSLTSDEKNAALKAIQTSPQGTNQFVGKNVLVHLRQDAFIAQDKDTGAIKFTEIDAATLVSRMPKQILKLINEKEQAGVDMSKMPVILFSNKVAGHGFGFYNDYEEKELKNSKAYKFVQEIGGSSSSTTASTSNAASGTTQKSIPNF